MDKKQFNGLGKGTNMFNSVIRATRRAHASIFVDLVGRGRNIYLALGCHVCHIKEGWSRRPDFYEESQRGELLRWGQRRGDSKTQRRELDSPKELLVLLSIMDI